MCESPALPSLLVRRLITTSPRQWADNEKEESFDADRNQHRSAQTAAYELGGKAASSWTKSVLEVQTEQAQVLWYVVKDVDSPLSSVHITIGSFHEIAPIIGFDNVKGYR